MINFVVNFWFELDLGFDDINGGEGIVGDGIIKSICKSEFVYFISDLNK